MWRNELALGWSEAIVALVVCTVTLIVWRWRNQQKTACTVAELWLYPIKGCRGNKVERMAFDRVGPKGDRRWMIVDSQTKRFLSAREKRKMVLITPKLQDDGTLAVDAPGMPTLTVPVATDSASATGAPITVTVWDDELEAKHVSAVCDAWFTEFLGVGCQLVAALDTDDHRRGLPPK